MEYGFIALELLVAAKQAERARAMSRSRWVDELRRTAPGVDPIPRSHRLAVAMRVLAGPARGPVPPVRRITRAMRRVAGSIRATSGAD